MFPSHQPHVALFLRGTEHYRQKEWPAVIVSMEAALEAFLESEERCRFACEKPFDMGWFPDFVPAVANHFTFCLRCKRRCQAELENLNGETVEDVLPLMYHYLQFAYFQGILTIALRRDMPFKASYFQREISSKPRAPCNPTFSSFPTTSR